MRSLIILTEVYDPEKFIINDLVKSFLEKNIKISLVTRVPSYPTGIPFKGYKNRLKKHKISENFEVYRFPVFKGYGKSKVKKILNFLFQPFWYFYIFIFHLKKHDAMFVYQTGSLYNYSLIFPKLKSQKAVIWSQDLWPDAAKENGLKSELFLKLLHSISKKILNRFEVLSQSRSFHSYYLEKYDINSKVLYCFSEKPNNTNELDNECDVKGKLLYAGNLGSVQNLKELFSTYETLYHQKIVKFLDVFGGGSQYKRYKDQYENRLGIRFKGPYEHEDLFEAKKKYEFLIFSLNPGIMRKVVPGRFVFCVNNNLPILYIGDGEISELIKEYKIGISVNDNDKCIENSIREIQDFRKIDTKELRDNFTLIESNFDKNNIINEIHKSLGL
ncbi:hypothetical protein OAL09_01845 [Verrucomicrobia bacterium]|nr:hypothetical protein [Verrucomicrobiota bacterium]